MEQIRRLGDEVERRWRELHFNEGAFPDVALECLREAELWKSLRPADVARWTVGAKTLPFQFFIENSFGEPQVTLFAGFQFCIDALFWVDGTTAIHQHAFSGAFHVLEGSSIHTQHQWSPERKINSRFLVGRVSPQRSEYLRRGECRPIRSGAGFIHSLFHLDRPSVTIVVRTINDPEAGIQYKYYRPNVAFDSSYGPQRLVRRAQMLDTLASLRTPDFESFARDAIRDLDPFSAFVLLDRVKARDEHFDVLLDCAKPALGEFEPLVRECFVELRRQRGIVARRRMVADPEHRFFLALLLNVRGRSTILEFVRQRFPERSPIDAVMGWTKQLAETAGGAGMLNAIDLELGEAELFVFRCLLEGQSTGEVIERMKAEFDAADVAEEAGAIGELCEGLRRSVLFEPLFAE